MSPADPAALARAYTEAWNTGQPDAVASFFAPSGSIVINGGTPWQGRTGVAQMAQGFFDDIPDLALICDGVRHSGRHIVYLWTFTGTHNASQKPVRISGWEEWDLDGLGQIISSMGWFDGDDYAFQTTSD
jgi:uncharacterized protein (TIGR02246 family)